MKRPAFQFYPQAWIASLPVRRMTDQQRGWYIQLLCEAWESKVQGTLPDDPKVLWVLAGASDEKLFKKNCQIVLDQFKKQGDHLIHEKLCEQIGRLDAISDKNSIAGKKSAFMRMQAYKNQHLEKLNGRSTGVESPFNANPTPYSQKPRAIKEKTEDNRPQLHEEEQPF